MGYPNGFCDRTRKIYFYRKKAEPLAKLPTGKCDKLISTPKKPFFEPGRARNAIFGSLPRYFFVFIKIRA
jgi:hypothetical protein